MKNKLKKELEMDKIITESGMDFIADNAFHIEKSEIYTKLKNRIKTVEFVRAKGDKLLFMEAKSSFPNPNNPSHDNPANFQNQINDICEKFIHSLNLYSSIATGVSETVLPADFNVPDKISISFVLVIENLQLDWCKPVKTKLEQSLPHYLKQIWQPAVFVINHETATRQNLTRNRLSDNR
jgi:hypothetical protein